MLCWYSRLLVCDESRIRRRWREAGHAAYVYVIEGKLTTRIDVQLTPVDAATTWVRVVYERTALSPSVNQDIAEMAQTDPKMGSEWQKAIGEYLKGRETGTR